MHKLNLKDDLLVTSSGCPGKILLAISGILWVLASVLFAACVHCAVCAPIPANAIYDWIDNIPALGLGILLTLVAFGLLSFRAILDFTGRKRGWASKGYDNVRREKLQWEVMHVSREAVEPAAKVFHIQLGDSYTDVYDYMCFIFSALSFGKIQAEELPDKGESLDEWKKSIDDKHEQISDLCKIWESELSDFTLHLKPYNLLLPDAAWVIGRALDIEDKVEAYFADVPLEDIIA